MCILPTTGGPARRLRYHKQRFAMADIEVLSVVALLQDLPEEGLVRGQVGAVVENSAPGVYEVEFSDGNRQGLRHGRPRGRATGAVASRTGRSC